MNKIRLHRVDFTKPVHIDLLGFPTLGIQWSTWWQRYFFFDDEGSEIGQSLDDLTVEPFAGALRIVTVEGSRRFEQWVDGSLIGSISFEHLASESE